MASGILLSNDHHSDPYSLDLNDVMRKGPKMAKFNMEVPIDLRILKRKSMSLNHDAYNHSQVSPAVVMVDLARLSRDQKSELRKKLKRNLEEVRTVGSRIDAWVDVLLKVKQQPSAVEPQGEQFNRSDTNGIRTNDNGQIRKDGASVISDPASSSGETPRDVPKESSQREPKLSRQLSLALPDVSPGTPSEKLKRIPKANQLYLNSEFVSGNDKLPASEKPKPKRIPSMKGDRDPKRQKVEAARSKRQADLLKQCTTIIRRLMGHKHGWVFNEPVDAEKLALHDYHTIIEKPMDLGTIKKKLNSKHYPSPVEFSDDVRLTFANAMTYNAVGHDVHIMAKVLNGVFEEWWKGMTKKLEEEKRRVDREEEILANDDESLEDISDLKRWEREMHSLVRGKTGSRAAAQPKPRPDETGKRPMTFEEKRKLSVHLERLPGDKLERIVQIIKKRNPELGQNEDEIEVDIDSFDNDTLWELDRFVTNYMKSRGKKSKSKTQVHRAQAAQQVSASAGIRGRRSEAGGEAGEEELDIDDDMAPTKFAPVVVDQGGRESSSSGSDSSDSGSSDSDSDSGSSSGSESEAEDDKTAGAGPKASHDKDPVGSDLVGDRKGSPTPVLDAAKKDEDLLPDDTAPERPVSPENSPPARQVSPDKALRAALLRGRFADIIVKSQEKPLPVNKNDKVDPEKLRKDREELEKRQREEKARLHAEAKAAEVTKRKAEEQAALVEKQKREVEREEARRALQQMEKTVEIDENSAILKDLERLRSGPLDPMLGPSHDDGLNEEGSPDGPSSFALQGGNPLEQLGLFMRHDDEDDEPHEQEDEEKASNKSVQVADETVENTALEKEVDVEDGEIGID